MGRVWSDANKYARWLDVEFAATETLAEAGQVPKESAVAIRARAKVDVARILELEYLGDEVRMVAVLPARLAADCGEWFSDDAPEKQARIEKSYTTQ